MSDVLYSFVDSAGITRLEGTIDPAPGGGLPTGWTEDDSDPGNVSTNGGSLEATDPTLAASLTADDGANGFSSLQSNGGVQATGAVGTPAFQTFPNNGATVALDAGGLDILNAGTVDGSTLGGTFSYVSTDAAAPTTFTTPLYYDSTAVTGGLYAWNGAAYVQIGALF